MKHIIAILLAALLLTMTGCGNGNPTTQPQTETSGQTETSASADTSTGVSFVYNAYCGCSTDDGYYFTEIVETADGDMHNIVQYIDYASAIEIPLCGRGNCAHDTIDCPAYLDTIDCQGMFTSGGKLYIICTGIDVNDDSVFGSLLPMVYVCNLDGTDRRTLATATSGADFDRDIAVGNGSMYVVLRTHELVDTGDNSFTDRIVSGTLAAIDLTSGAQTELCSLGDMSIVGANGDDIFLEAIADPGFTYSVYNTRTGELRSIGAINYTTARACTGGFVYHVAADGGIYRLSADGSDTLQIGGLQDKPDEIEPVGDRLRCMVYNGDNTDRCYMLNPADNSVTEMNLWLEGNEARIPATVLADAGDRLVVVNSVQMRSEYVAWAGVTQTVIDSQTISLISKADFFASNPAYTAITRG